MACRRSCLPRSASLGRRKITQTYLPPALVGVVADLACRPRGIRVGAVDRLPGGQLDFEGGRAMTITQAVIDTLRGLPPEDQQKVLQLVESLTHSKQLPAQRKNPRGLFADRGVHITAEEIDEARRQAWSDFPRGFPGNTAP